MKDLSNYSLLQHNTFGIDAKCRRFLEYASIEEAQQVAAILRESSLPYIIIGGGSNLLLTQDFDGIVVHSAIKGIHSSLTTHHSPLTTHHSPVVCGSGEIWDDVVDYAVHHQLYGAENLSLIPGDVGVDTLNGRMYYDSIKVLRQ